MATTTAPAAQVPGGLQSDVAAIAGERSRETTAEVAKEVRDLRRWSYRALGALIAMATASGVGVILVLPSHPMGPGSGRLLAVALLGGMLGSAASAIRSLCERLAAGFELDDGHQVWPPHAHKGAEKMNVRMIPYLLARPFLGGATGLVAYAGVVGGFLVATAKEPATFSPEGILFFALLAGLFAKTFLHRMDIVFKTLLGEVGSHSAGKGDSGTESPKRAPAEADN